jgi:hypothetical protein
MTLTVKVVDAAKPREKAYKLADAHGLYLFFSPTGAKSWRPTTPPGGQQKTRTYGLYPTLSLAGARKEHAAAREVVPSPEAAPTFETVARDWFKASTVAVVAGFEEVAFGCFS